MLFDTIMFLEGLFNPYWIDYWVLITRWLITGDVALLFYWLERFNRFTQGGNKIQSRIIKKTAVIMR